MNVRATICIWTALFSVAFVSCGQSKYGIKKVYAFRSEHLPGINRMDDQGQPVNPRPDTVYAIYVETSGASPEWLHAWKDGQSYSVYRTTLEGVQEVGVSKSTNEKVMLRASHGNKLWLLQLQKNPGLPKVPVAAKQGEIILQGKKGKKSFIQKVSSIVELEPIPSV